MTKDLSEKELKALRRKIRIEYDAKYVALWNERDEALSYLSLADTPSALRNERTQAVVRFYSREFDTLVEQEVVKCRHLGVSK